MKSFDFVGRASLENQNQNTKANERAKKRILTPEENLAKMTRLQRRNSMTTFESTKQTG
jgi:hypothetical protein